MRRAADRQNIFCVCAVAFCIMLTLGLCMLLSGEGLLGAVFSKDGEDGAYMIAVGGYTDITLARTTAELVASRGGAGYVTGDGEYEIIYAVYKSEGDANSVLSSLGDSAAYVKKIDMPSPKLKWADKGMKEAAQAALKYYPAAFDALYECSNHLNGKTLTIQDVKNRIRVLRAQIEDIKSAFYSYVGDEGDGHTVSIKVALITALALVDNVELDGGEAQAASSLRYQLVQLTLSYSALMSDI